MARPLRRALCGGGDATPHGSGGAKATAYADASRSRVVLDKRVRRRHEYALVTSSPAHEIRPCPVLTVNLQDHRLAIRVTDVVTLDDEPITNGSPSLPLLARSRTSHRVSPEVAGTGQGRRSRPVRRTARPYATNRSTLSVIGRSVLAHPRQNQDIEPPGGCARRTIRPFCRRRTSLMLEACFHTPLWCRSTVRSSQPEPCQWRAPWPGSVVAQCSW